MTVRARPISHEPFSRVTVLAGLACEVALEALGLGVCSGDDGVLVVHVGMISAMMRDVNSFVCPIDAAHLLPHVWVENPFLFD